jgi:hypothetical protein
LLAILEMNRFLKSRRIKRPHRIVGVDWLA